MSTDHAMTGPEHYREAERLLTEAGEYTAARESAHQVALVQRAAVHATLAQAAATALVAQGMVDSYGESTPDKGSLSEWRKTVNYVPDDR